MNTKTKLIALTTATLIALAPATASSANMSDGVFSWPTDYSGQATSVATSTFDGKAQNLEIKETKKDKTPGAKRK